MKDIRLAPLAGVTDWPFRQLCFEQLCDTAYTEMVSATGYVFAPSAEATQHLLYRSPSDKKLILQLFGNNPEHIASAARSLSESGRYDGIDLNMGCPVRKVACGGEGSGLMRTPQLASEVMEALVKNSAVPVSVKMRLGWSEDSRNYLEICERAQDAGVQSICIHGRTRDQMYSGTADWDSIYEAASRFSLPVYGNGDIFTAQDAVKRLSGGPIAGILIGRGAMGNPWIFRQVHCALRGENVVQPNVRDRMEMASRHFSLLLSWKPEHIAVKEIRKHIAWYFHGIRGAAQLRNEVNRIAEPQKVFSLLEAVAEGYTAL